MRTNGERLAGSLCRDVHASSEKLKEDPLYEIQALRQEVQTDIHASTEKLKEDLRQEVQIDVRASTEKVKEELHHEIQALRKEVQTDVRASTEKLKEDLLRENQALRQEAQVASEKLTAELETARQGLESQLRTLQAGLTTDVGRLQQSLDAISAEVKGITDTLATPPQPEGLLVQDFPAPPGQEQKDYESRLFRAYFAYVYNLWDPEVKGSMGEDSGTLDDIKAKFPNLEETAIITALEHFHALVFNQPIKRG